MFAHFTLRTFDVNKVFFRKKIGFDDSFDVTKWLQQLGMPKDNIVLNLWECLIYSMCAHSEMSNHLL